MCVPAHHPLQVHQILLLALHVVVAERLRRSAGHRHSGERVQLLLLKLQEWNRSEGSEMCASEHWWLRRFA